MEKSPRAFTSALTRGEAVAVLAYFPLHLILLPSALTGLMASAGLSASMANFILYAIGAVYMTALAHGFLRREYDGVCERTLRVFIGVFSSYALLLCFNLASALVFTLLLPELTNPNNKAVTDTIAESYGPMAAAAVFLAPIVEELLFRAGLFGLLRRRSRGLAYAVSMAAFALYHVWGYAVNEPVYLIYLLQYLPAAWLLCRCYERSDTIWSSIFLHMLINGISMNVLRLYG